MTIPSHVLILEGALTGHHSVYLERIATIFLEGGSHATVTVLNRDLNHPCLVRLKERFGSRVNFQAIDDHRYDQAFSRRTREVGREWSLRRLFGELYEKTAGAKAVDFVFLPYLDHCLYAIGALGSPFGKTRWGGICMRPSFHHPAMGVDAPKPKLALVKRLLFFKLLEIATLAKIFTIDELLVQFARKVVPKLAGRLSYLADPGELIGSCTREAARAEIGISPGHSVVLVSGSIDRRKGLDVILSACVLTHASLLVVGKQSEWAKGILAGAEARELQSQGRLYVIDRFVSENEQQMVFVASDMVWLGYTDHYGMSGILVLAAIANKPVISTAKGLIGWYSAKYQLGPSLDPVTPKGAAQAINYLMENSILPAKRLRFLEGRDWQSFGQTIRNHD